MKSDDAIVLTKPMREALELIAEQGNAASVRGGTLSALQTRDLVEWSREQRGHVLTAKGEMIRAVLS